MSGRLMALTRRRDHAKVWMEFLNFFVIIIPALLYMILLVASEPVCYTLLSLDERNRYKKRVDCDGTDKICHRFASSEDVNLGDLLTITCSTTSSPTFTDGPFDCAPNTEMSIVCNDWHVWNGSEYKYISTRQTWEKSGQMCESENSHLVTIENKGEDCFVHKMIVDCNQKKSRWVSIGLNDRNKEGTWEWSDGTVSTYRNWYEKQPDGGDAHDCVRMMKDNGKWSDYQCTFVYSAVCERNNPLT